MSRHRTPVFVVIAAAAAVIGVACATASEPTTVAVQEQKPVEKSVEKKSPYPESKRGDVVDELHGTKVPDPYRWLEDPDAADTVAWVQAQNKVTFDWLGKVATRDAMKQRLTTLWNYERYSAPFVEGKGKNRRTYFWKNDGLQNQAVLYVVDAEGKEPRMLLDPNALSADGTVALAGMAISDDGALMAYALSTGGSDWMEWRVKDVATGTDKPDVVKWSKFSGASWTPDGKGFFYSRYPEPEKGADLEQANYFHKVYFHTVGEPQEKDQLVFEDKEHDKRGFAAGVTEDGAYLIIQVWEGTDRRNRVYFKDLKKKDAAVVKLFDAFDASYGVIGNVGSTFYVVTDKDAPRQRLVKVDVKGLKSPEPKLVEVIAQPAKDKIESVSMIGGGFLVKYLRDAHDVVEFFDLKGKKVRELPLPTIGTSGGFAGKSKDTETYYSFTSFTYPTVIYKLDLKSGVSTLWKQPKVAFNVDDFETKQVFYPSVDGTKIPMFIVHKKGLKLDGNNPTYLYAYGGFNISLTPSFSPALIGLLEQGFVFAQPNLRGGGEYGEEWHEAGMLKKKQNVFDDFASAARYLVAEKYTSHAKIGIGGGSNGGLLVGASLTQHPELFGAGVAMVGVMDMLRFHKFTIGHAWVSEYGSADDKDMFPTLLGYSPLHNLKPGTSYPPTLITTADHDDRVVPAHSFKFAAAMQHAQGGQAPILIRIDVKAGHGAGKPTSKLIDEAADRWSFLMASLGTTPMPALQ
jgi:prolyl oligopeptidase